MKRMNRGTLAALVSLAMLPPGWVQAETSASAPVAGQSAPAPIPQEKLDSLLAPIALYPDQLLAQALMASTYPLDVVEAARFVRANKELKGAALDQAVAQKKWDPSVQSLTAFPQVLEMMDNKLEWTQAIGDAFLADKQRVMQTVQSLRQKAEAAGNLKSNEQQKVVKEQSVIIIEPAKPEVVYVPTYNPTVVYGAWWAPTYPPYYYPPPAYYYPTGGAVVAAGLIGFGLGVAAANNHWGWSNCDWHGGDVNVNVNKNNTFVNNNAEFKNKAQNGNWQHNASQRKGVAYGDAKTREQFSRSDPGAASSRRDARGQQAGTSDRGQGGMGGDRGGAGDRGQSGFGDRGQGGAGDRGQAGGGNRAQAGTSDRSRDSWQGSGGGAGRTESRPSFDSGQSRQSSQAASNRGAASRSSMSGGGGGGGARASSGGSRGGGGGGGGRGGGGRGR
jgi:hypothetical protein